MDIPEQKELEDFIDRQLQKLPEREAPEDLAASVMARILARENLPWWKKPFTSWPRGMQSALFAILGSVFSAAVYLAARPAQAVSIGAITETASSLSWIGSTLSSLSRLALIALQSLSWEWLLAMAVVFCAMYAACIGAGMALYRVTSAARLRPA